MREKDHRPYEIFPPGRREKVDVILRKIWTGHQTSCGSQPSPIIIRWTGGEHLNIRISGRGEVSLQELQARFSAYLNAGAPEPIVEGTSEEKKAVFREVAIRGDSQMKTLMDSYLKREEPEAAR